MKKRKELEAKQAQEGKPQTQPPFGKAKASEKPKKIKK
jgi:hypothetical protein